MIDTPDAVSAGQGIQVIYQVGPGHAFAVDCLGHAALEIDLDVGRLIGSVCHRTGPIVGVFGRFHPGVFQFSGFHAPAPEVLVGGEPAAVRVDRQTARLTVFDLVIPAHAPIAYGSNYIDVRAQSCDAHFQADLVVAFAGAAVGDGISVVLPGRRDQIPGDERASQGRGQRVLLLVDRPGLQGREQEFVDQRVPAVDRECLDCADTQRPLADGLQVHHSQVDGQGDYVCVVLLLQPRDRHCGVQSPAVSQHDLWFRHLLVGLLHQFCEFVIRLFIQHFQKLGGSNLRVPQNFPH